MKKIKTNSLILLAIIVAILIFLLVINITNNNNTKENEKVISEIKYMDTKLTYLLNSVNNITLENFKISVTKTSTDAQGKDEEKTATEQYGLKEQRVLTSQDETDWEAIRNEIEILYSTIPTMTLDLYSMNINQEQILNFNRELDELMVISSEENKEKTLMKLANLYRYLPAYVNSIPNNSDYASLLETKSNVFNSYVFASIDNWDEAKKYIRKAVESYSIVLGRINDSANYYNTNKIYIILNELQNATDISNRDVFFIKYKTFLEETEK